MLNPIIIILTTLSLSMQFLPSNAQNTFFIGSKKYPCSESFELWSDAGFEGEVINIVMVKDGESGMLALSKSNGFGAGLRIKGKIFIYLENGDIITCVDRSKYDYVDKVATTIYTITKEEIEKIKKNNIHKIRYTLKCIDCSWSGDEGDFTVLNEETTAGYTKSTKVTKDKIDFSKIAKELF